MSFGDKIVGQWLDNDLQKTLDCETLMTPPPVRRQNAERMNTYLCPNAPRKSTRDIDYPPPTKMRKLDLDIYK
jgi:hypothetical protein